MVLNILELKPLRRTIAMRMNMGPDRLISAIVLIVVGLLQVTNTVFFPPFLVIICLGLMIMMNR